VKVLFADGSNPKETAALASKADVAIVVVGNHPECNAGWDQCPFLQTARKTWIARRSCWSRRNWSSRCLRPIPDDRGVAVEFSLCDCVERAESAGDCPHHAQQRRRGPRAGRRTVWRLLAGRAADQTWPTGDAQLLPILDYNLLHGRTYLYSKDKPLYAFGYGLSYTSFAYEGVKVSAPRWRPMERFR